MNVGISKHSWSRSCRRGCSDSSSRRSDVSARLCSAQIFSSFGAYQMSLANKHGDVCFINHSVVWETNIFAREKRVFAAFICLSLLFLYMQRDAVVVLPIYCSDVSAGSVLFCVQRKAYRLRVCVWLHNAANTHSAISLARSRQSD